MNLLAGDEMEGRLLVGLKFSRRVVRLDSWHRDLDSRRRNIRLPLGDEFLRRFLRRGFVPRPILSPCRVPHSFACEKYSKIEIESRRKGRNKSKDEERGERLPPTPFVVRPIKKCFFAICQSPRHLFPSPPFFSLFRTRVRTYGAAGLREFHAEAPPFSLANFSVPNGRQVNRGWW